MKHALVTGGTSGIGNGVAHQLAEQGWKVTLVGRNVKRGTSIADAIGGKFIGADLSLMSEVNRLSLLVEEPLDALILCAGGVSFHSKPILTTEGLETTFASNYLSKFALSEWLHSRINPNGCIVMVGGNGKYSNAPSDWNTPHPSFKAAFKSALAVDSFAARFAKLNKEIRVHTCYPGMVRTNLMHDAAAPIRLVTWLLSKPVEKGSSYITRLVTEEHQEVHWKLDTPMNIYNPLSEEAVDSLWAYSKDTLNNIVPNND
ncbi:SDR family NAD(P)-dependent oxidoreductase [Paenibacillus sp. GSMTC-2017]|uniref:SDR family NAD(P)-dependent oxidoreductase n=1 Tax=Paenibacillus sp. GSMTC-2017 TaxID=2794350 RepID=UPI0018D60016|nr:SDR family NAD(P)-dependent oxidoreductase [Paenibacillus sp. GSMTC-2017]MBH5316237.1 SDR family NAD(P)-dependent oxidoreductase [Paenibacillus sp. GSMTC-2017]